jgi:hypothetical protein
MITPHLEKLIFEGKAQYKTFVGGYSQKHIINVPDNRYIIITDLWYTPTLYYNPRLAFDPDPLRRVSIDDQFKRNMLTQLTIIGKRGFNRFLFKNSITKDFLTPDPLKPLERNFYSANNPIHLSCYLIHTDGVSLTFSNQDLFVAVTNIVAPEIVPALETPGDYGKLGIPGSIPVIDFAVTGSGYQNNFVNVSITPTVPGTNELSFPVDNTTNLDQSVKEEAISYPILNIAYVEIQGQPHNIGY